jgi:hypothetical protein
MVWQYLQIILRALFRYILLRLKYARSGSWVMHRYQTGHMLLSKTIELCDERRRFLVMAERRAAEKKAQKKLKAEQVYASKNKDKVLESESPQQEE